MDKMAVRTELGSSTAFENPLGNMTASNSSAKGSEADPYLVMNIVVILLASAVLVPLNVLLLKKNISVFRTVFLTKYDHIVQDHEFIRKNRGESLTVPTIPKEGPILVVKNVDLQRCGSPHSTIVDIAYSFPREGSVTDTGEPKVQTVRTFSGGLKTTPNVQDLDLSARFAETLLPDPNMKGQTEGLLASTSKYDGEVIKTVQDRPLSTSSERKKKEEVDNEIFDATFDQCSTDGPTMPTGRMDLEMTAAFVKATPVTLVQNTFTEVLTMPTSGMDLERAVEVVEMEIPKLSRMSLTGKERLEKVEITTPDTKVQKVFTEGAAMPRDKIEFVDTAAVVEHSVKQARPVEKGMPMTSSVSTGDSRAAWEDYGKLHRASTASWTSSGRLYGVSSDTALQTQISQAMRWHLSEFEASPSTVDVETSDRKSDNTFPEGSSLSINVATQGVLPSLKHGTLIQRVRLVEEGISTSPTASTGVFRKTARQIRLVQQGMLMSPEVSNEESRKAAKQVSLDAQETPTSSTISSEEPHATQDDQGYGGSRRASPSSWSLTGGSNASLQTEISHALQNYFSRKSSVQAEDIKEVAEDPDVVKT